MKTKEVLSAINGKKLPISMIIAGTIAVATLQAEVGNIKEDVIALEPVKEQVARIDERVEGLKEDFTDFRTEQRKVNDRMEDNIGKILEAVR